MIVGVASVLFPDTTNAASASNPLLGDVIIVLAQIIAAVQMVVEEKLVSGRGIHALQAVGWEGVWGFGVLSCVLVGMFYAPGLDGFTAGLMHFEDTPDALAQIANSRPLAAACFGNILSIAFFNVSLVGKDGMGCLFVVVFSCKSHFVVVVCFFDKVFWVVGDKTHVSHASNDFGQFAHHCHLGGVFDGGVAIFQLFAIGKCLLLHCY